MKKFPVTMNWVRSSTGYLLPVLYDQKVVPVDEFNSYLLHVANEKIETDPSPQAYKSEIELHAYSMKGFLTFLCRNDIPDWRQFEDSHFVSLRNWMLTETLSESNASKEKNAAKRTTNRKLRVVYSFYTWAQETMGYISKHIGLGSEYRINSALPLQQRSENIKRTDKRIYPKCFKRCGEGSRNRFEYSATEEDKAKLINLFTEGGKSLYTAERNILIMELADQCGWRNGSINCLTVDQFSDEAIRKTAEDYILVTPSVQKLAYENSFQVPLPLAIRVNKHIKDSRKAFIDEKRKNPASVHSELFLSSTTAKRLGNKTIVQIFSAAMKEIGCPRGSGIHSFRRKFAQDTSDKEIEFRRKNKLSLASEDTGLVIARKLGQASTASQETYIKSMANASEGTVEARLLREMKSLSNELAATKLENAKLIKIIEKLES